MDLVPLLMLWLVCHLARSIEDFATSSGLPARIQYSREFLLHLEKTYDPPVDFNPPNLDDFRILLEPRPRDPDSGSRRNPRTRKRGKRGGARLKVNKRPLTRIPLPTIMLSNVQSLRNKADKLQARVKLCHEFSNACILALTETHLNDNDMDGEFRIDGFGVPIRQDRDFVATNKLTGGGVCLYINERWCKNVIVRERLCTADVELLSVSLRPLYLPREFPQLFVTLVYIHPKANKTNACELIHQVTQRLQTISPEAPNIVLGDVNQCTLSDTLRDFHQYVTCPTRGKNILDMCYGNIKDAYKSTSLHPLGLSDHNCVLLIPVYRTALKREKVQSIQVKDWNDDACLTLQGCLDCTDWDMFKESCNNIDELTDVTCSWISYCENTVIPVKTVKIYPNSKPWISKSIKVLLDKKKKAFREGNLIEMRNTEKEIKREIRAGKLRYKNKIENQLRMNNLGSAWSSMKTIVGLKEEGRTNIQLSGYNSDLQLAEEFNGFYTRFDVHDFKTQHSELRSRLVTSTGYDPSFDEQSVIRCFKRCQPKKSPGPDNIGGRLLSVCADQVGPIFNFIFQLSLSQQRVPSLWKRSIVVPVAKGPRPKGLNDFRPVALTSLIMKSFERLVKEELLTKTECFLDPLQFAYRAKRGVSDATITILNLLLKHLEGKKKHARLLFVDFSSAFNTIQPHILVEKLVNNFGLDSGITGWVLDFLTNRTQRVRVNGKLSGELTSSTGSPQGCVLSPLLYILYTNDCKSQHENRHIVKFADDSVIVSLLSDAEVCHGPVVDDFVSWCEEAFLQLNVTKTKDMCIDFRRSEPAHQSTVINGQIVDLVTTYKYLGSIIDNRLKFDVNTEMLCKKGQQRLFCLRKLAKFQVDKSLMILFYRAFIESVISFAVICWYGNLGIVQKNSLNGIVKAAGKIVGVKFRCLSHIYDEQVLKKASSIRGDSSHPLKGEYKLLPSGQWLEAPATKNNRYKFSFIPTSIRAINGGSRRR